MPSKENNLETLQEEAQGVLVHTIFVSCIMLVYFFVRFFVEVFFFCTQFNAYSKIEVCGLSVEGHLET